MTAAPGAFTRQRQATLRDRRLWAGLALVLASTIAGAAILGRSDAAVEVWRATTDLAPGAIPQAAPVRVALDPATASAYLPATAALEGRVVAPVPAGALIPASAIRPVPLVGRRLVTVPIDGGHVPLGLAAGERVDVWSSPVQGPGAAGPESPPRLVLASALVRDVQGDELGVGGDLPVAIEVDEDEVGDLVAAARSGVIDLVAVPFDDPS